MKKNKTSAPTTCTSTRESNPQDGTSLNFFFLLDKTAPSTTQKARFAMASALLALSLPTTVQAQESVTATQAKPGLHRFDIGKQPLYSALAALAEQGGIQFVYTAEMVKGLTSPGVTGQFTIEEALKRILEGSGLGYRFSRSNTITLEREAVPASSGSNSGDTIALDKMTVSATAEYDQNDPYNEDYAVPNAITATKTDTPIMETPVSIQVVPQQVLKDQQAIGLENVLKNVSGVQQLWGGGNFYDSFIIRGFPTLQHFRNGVRLPEHAIDLANVERVEVLKGPSAMLYGRIDPGGMISVVTKRPLATPYYSIQQQFGSYDLYRTTVDATGPITDNGELAYRFNLSYLDAGSYRDAVNRDRVFLDPSLSWRPTEDTEFNLSFEYRSENVPYDSGLPALNGRVIDVPISRNLNQPMRQDHIESKLVDFNWSHRFGEHWKIQNGVVAQLVDYEFRELPTAEFQTRFSLEDPFLRRGLYFEDFSRDMHTVYLNLTGEFETWGIRHKVLLGGDYYDKETNSKGFAAFAGTDEQRERFFTFVNVFDRSTLKPPIDLAAAENLRKTAPNDFGFLEESWYGLYFQDQITLWEKLHILGGGRHDWTRVKNAFSSQPIQDSDINIVNTEFFSPRVGIVYQPWSWLSIYGNFVESFGLNNGRSENNQPLDPETATNYEAGIKTEWFGGKLVSNLAYYHLTKENILTRKAVDVPILSTIGKARSQGIELDIAGEVYDGLSLIATYAYTDARITKNNDGNEGNRLPNVPEHAASFWGKYTFQQSELQGLSLGTGVYLASARQADTGNTVTLPGYVRWDAYAAYTFSIGATRLTTQLNVNNILDKRYFFNGDSQLFGASANNNFPGEPLTFMGLVRLEY